jgi:hypothetical protein
MYPSETLPAPEQPTMPVQEDEEEYLWPDEYDYSDKYERGCRKDEAKGVKQEIGVMEETHIKHRVQ